LKAAVKLPQPFGQRITALAGLGFYFESGKSYSDVNGSVNLIRKVKPNAFSYGLKGLPFIPVTLDPLRTHDFLQIV
jgi:hypothetical protein